MVAKCEWRPRCTRRLGDLNHPKSTHLKTNMSMEHFPFLIGDASKPTVGFPLSSSRHPGCIGF